MQKLLTLFGKNISVYAIFNDQSFKDMLTNDIVSFEQLGPGRDLGHAQDDVNSHILLMLKDTFSCFSHTYMNPDTNML